MNQILNIKWRILLNSVDQIREESRLKILFIFIFVLGYGVFGVLGIVKSFHYLLGFPVFGQMIIERMVYLYFFILFIMLTLSSYLLTCSRFFASAETMQLLLMPIRFEIIYRVKFLEVLYLASWASVFISIPIFIGHGIVLGDASLVYFFGLFLLFLPFVCMCSALGFILALVATRFFINRWGVLLLFLLAGGLIYSFLDVWSIRSEYVTTDIREIVERMLVHTQLSTASFLPSSWVSRVYLGLSGSSCNYLLYSLLILSFVCMVYYAFEIISSAIGFSAWSSYQSFSFRQKNQSVFMLFFRFLQRIISQKYSAIIAKDVQIFCRDPVQYLQFFIFFGLIFIYFFNIKNMRYNLDSPYWKMLITYLNFSSVNLILATLSTRFFFPEISFEGKCIWTLGLSRINRKEILYCKYSYSVFFSFIITFFLIFVSNYFLKVVWGMQLYFYCLSLVTSITLCAVSIGLGALFPDFNSENSAEVVSGFGGTLCLIVSVFYIGIVTLGAGFIGYADMRYLAEKNMMTGIYIAYLIISGGLSVGLSVWLLKKAEKRFSGEEI